MSTWIPTSGPGSRLPTREDADERGEVVWKCADSIAMIARWDEALCDPPPGAWLPLPPYTPPKPGPTDGECLKIIVILSNEGTPENEFFSIRKWFADVTARIEREKRK